ncbi:hypothetical protein BS78_06G193200 [Paspalum vaginatum]|nr:hypothetical protein BS78_06G193200 [Paspalum vaginatum]
MNGRYILRPAPLTMQGSCRVAPTFNELSPKVRQSKPPRPWREPRRSPLPLYAFDKIPRPRDHATPTPKPQSRRQRPSAQRVGSVVALGMMAAPEESPRRRRRAELCAAAVWAADAASWWCAVALVALVLLGALRTETAGDARRQFRGPRLGGPAARPCEEVYVVGDGETLHSISDRCGDPFIVERNPHIHDPDDVFPGLVIALRPTKNT